MNKAIEFDRVADLYDEYVRTELDIPFFVEEARNANGEVLELMSGTGRVSIPLIEAGIQLTCVDYSEKMLDQLRHKLHQQNLSADVRFMDVRALNVGKQFELIILPFNSFAEILYPEEQLQALEQIHRHLSPSGRFICTLHNPAIRLNRVDGLLRLWGKSPLEQGTLLFWGMESYDPETKIVSGVELFEEYDILGLLVRKRMMEHRFRLSDQNEFEQLARRAGFSIEVLYGDYQRSDFSTTQSPFMIWILKG